MDSGRLQTRWEVWHRTSQAVSKWTSAQLWASSSPEAFLAIARTSSQLGPPACITCHFLGLVLFLSTSFRASSPQSMTSKIQRQLRFSSYTGFVAKQTIVKTLNHWISLNPKSNLPFGCNLFPPLHDNLQLSKLSSIQALKFKPLSPLSTILCNSKKLTKRRRKKNSNSIFQTSRNRR